MRAIDADALMPHQRKAVMFYWSGEAQENVITVSEIEKAPTLEVEPVKHGRWENITVAVVDTTGYCSVCGEQAVWRSRTKPYAVCPNCGAKMDLE